MFEIVRLLQKEIHARRQIKREEENLLRLAGRVRGLHPRSPVADASASGSKVGLLCEDCHGKESWHQFLGGCPASSGAKEKQIIIAMEKN